LHFRVIFGAEYAEKFIQKVLMRIAMHELKAGLSRYVAQARAGEVIEVTSHDRPVARLTGIASADAPGIARLLARGAAQWRGGRPALAPAVPLGSDGKSVAEIVLEDRG
jgi:prevent-host-death family protein